MGRSNKKAIATMDALAIGFDALDCVLKGDPLSPVGLETDVELLLIVALVDSADIFDTILAADAELTLAAMLIGVLELDAEIVVAKTTVDVDKEDTVTAADDVPNGNGVGRAGVTTLEAPAFEDTTGAPIIVVALLYISGIATVCV